MPNFKQEVQNLKSELIALRRKLHMKPELGMEEYETSKVIMNFLENEKISYEKVANTGVCAIIEGEKFKSNRTIALRADIDALPIIEEKESEYKSQTYGKMHACGHDAHIAILLITSKILNKYKKSFGGNIKLLFEPAEETIGGARLMIEEGVLKSPDVEVVCGLHVEDSLESGKIMIKSGVVNAASNPFDITIIGAGGHGASPQLTVDPINIASHIITSLQSIISREISPLSQGVISIGSIHGGVARNVIPKEVNIKGIIRSLKKDEREYIVTRVRNIAEGICSTFKGKAIINIEESYPCLYNNESMVNNLKKAANKILGEENIIKQEQPKMGVESFAYFANEKPSVFYFLGSRNESKGIVHPAHSSLFDIDEECLLHGVGIQCQVVYDYLTSN